METVDYKAVRRMLRLITAVIFTGWMVLWIMRPTSSYTKFWKSFIKQTPKSYAGHGPYTLLYAAPILIGAITALLYLHVRDKKKIKNVKHESMRWRRMWRYPLFTQGPLSLASAGEAGILLIFLIFLLYSYVKYLDVSFKAIKHTAEPIWKEKLDTAGSSLGTIGVVCFALLFFPVTRNSAFLQLLNVPFQHAVKYHIWIANIMLFVWTAHGLVYIVFWKLTNQMHKLWEWDKTDVSGLSGLMAILIGFVILATSLGPVRKHKFELFYYTHHMYLLFIVFFGLHIGDKLFSAVLGGMLLFFVDRLLRFLQSRRKIDVISAEMKSSETMELVLPKDPELHYSPASCIFLNVPAVSRMQWHPFTVTSSSNVDRDHISLLIKCTGNWTSKLKGLITQKDRPSDLVAAVEGPYGHDLEYLYKYETLCFVAGGSGISPFISILKDMFHEIQMQHIPAPKQITLVYIVRHSAELIILESVVPDSIYPEYAKSVKLDILAYVTRESGTDVEANLVQIPTRLILEKSKTTRMSSNDGTIHAEPSPNSMNSYMQKTSRTRAVLSVAGDHSLHLIIVILASFAGYLSMAGIISRYYVYPIDHNTYKVFPRSGRGLLAFLEMAVGIGIFGGVASFIWRSLWKRPQTWIPEETRMTELGSGGGLKPSIVHYGRRPDFQGIFSDHVRHIGAANMGVFACGPRSMQEDVARHCKSNTAIYHYHALSYEL